MRNTLISSSNYFRAAVPSQQKPPLLNHDMNENRLTPIEIFGAALVLLLVVEAVVVGIGSILLLLHRFCGSHAFLWAG